MARWDDHFLPERAFQPRAVGPFAHTMGMTLEGGKGGSAPDPNPGMIATAQATEKVGMAAIDLQREYMTWAKDFYDQLSPTLQAAAKQQYEIAAANQQRADEYYDYEKNTFRPLEKSIVEDAMNYDTEAKREQLATRAAGDVSQAFGVARDQAGRQFQAQGIRADSGRFAALNNQLNIQEALARAGSQTNARAQAEDLAYARKLDAAGLGRNLAPNASTAYGVSLNASGQGTGTSMAGGNFMNSAYGQGSNMLGQASSAYGTAGNIYGQEFNARMSGYNAQQAQEGAFWGGLGNMAGMIGSKMISSKGAKEHKRGISKGEALEGINNLDVEKWKYKDGIADGKEHIGPYAEDFKREFGVGNGKEISLQDALGVTMKAVQDLTEEVRGLKKANGGRIHKGKGPVSGPGGPVDDKIPAMLSDGEYVLPADTVKKIGVNKLDQVVKKTHTPAAVQRARKRGLKGKK